jgi:undecaprenyl-diphosphatase
MYQIIFLSIVQIVFESVPVSSSGHVQLVAILLAMASGTSEICLHKTYEYFLHGPTAVILAALFFATWWMLLTNAWRWRTTIFRLCLYAGVADVCTAVGYFFLQAACVSWFPLWIGFCITGIALYSVRYMRSRGHAMHTSALVDMKKICVLGVVQGIAVLPGVSRLGITYAVGLLLGLSPRKSFAVSCMIQFPLIVAGFCYGLVYARTDVQIVYVVTHITPIGLLMAASLVAYYVLKCVQKSAWHGTWWKMAYYMIVPTVGALLLM